MELTKLDNYDYTLLPGVIRIKVDSNRDPDIPDILSEIQYTKGKIYVENNYYHYLDQFVIFEENDKHYLDLWVIQDAEFKIGDGKIV